jgi:transglutaminase-like putative cysteine protease
MGGRVSRGWRLRVAHTTRVSYVSPVRISFNEARMTPLTLLSQVTLESRVTVGGGVPVWTYNDYWGTYVSVFDLPESHSDLEIAARSTVETEPPPALPKPLSWAELRSAAGSGRLDEFLLPTSLTTLDDEVAATELASLRADPHETAERVSARVREQVRYMTGATGVRTNAQEAWDQGQGVCQDMAHVTVALLRAAGMPARYVSGYLHADPSAEPGETIAGQSHAWVEYWAGEWAACDPTSGAPVGERHVVVARGRDYDDVPPLKGIYHGPPASTLDVSVEVTRLA